MADETAAPMGRELRELRNLRGLAAKDVDQALGWRTNKTAEIENGAIHARFDDIEAYVSFLGYNLSEFQELVRGRAEYENDPLRAKVRAEATGTKSCYFDTRLDLQDYRSTPLLELEVPVG